MGRGHGHPGAGDAAADADLGRPGPRRRGPPVPALSPGPSVTGGQGAPGALAAGAESMDVLTSTSGVGGTRIRPRVGRSRSRVTVSRTVTSKDAISTVETPRPNVARWRASALSATAAPTTSRTRTAVGTRLLS